VIALLLGCTGGLDSGAQDGPFFDGEPTITALTWGCVVEDSEWLFNITTDHWTGGGRIYMTDDLTVIEEHRVRSVGAEADGSADALELSLDVVSDWRDASASSSTRWRCDDLDRLTFLATVFTPDGDSRSDCRVWGADPLLWDDTKDSDTEDSDTKEVEGCQTVLEEDSDTGTPQ
jgi:hypothetical protein